MNKRGVLSLLLAAIILVSLSSVFAAEPILPGQDTSTSTVTQPGSITLRPCAPGENSKGGFTPEGDSAGADICIPQSHPTTPDTAESNKSQFPLVEQWEIKFFFNDAYLNSLINLLNTASAQTDNPELIKALNNRADYLSLRKFGLPAVEAAKAKLTTDLNKVEEQMKFGGNTIVTFEGLSNQQKTLNELLKQLNNDTKNLNAELTAVKKQIDSLTQNKETIPSDLSAKEEQLGQDLIISKKNLGDAQADLKIIDGQIKSLPLLIDQEKNLKAQIDRFNNGEAFMQSEIDKAKEKFAQPAQAADLKVELDRINKTYSTPGFSSTAEATCFFFENAGRCAAGPLNIFPQELGCSGNIAFDLDFIEVSKSEYWGGYWGNYWGGTVGQFLGSNWRKPLQALEILPNDKGIIAQIGGATPKVTVTGQSQCTDYYFKSFGGNADTDSALKTQIVEKDKIIPLALTDLTAPSRTLGGTAKLVVAREDQPGRPEEIFGNAKWTAVRVGGFNGVYDGLNVVNGQVKFPDHYKELIGYLGRQPDVKDPIVQATGAKQEFAKTSSFLGVSPLNIATKVFKFPGKGFRVAGDIFRYTSSGIKTIGNGLISFINEKDEATCAKEPDKYCCQAYTKLTSSAGCKPFQKKGLIASAWDKIAGLFASKKAPTVEGVKTAVAMLNGDQKAALEACKQKRLISPASFGDAQALLNQIKAPGAAGEGQTVATDLACLCEVSPGPNKVICASQQKDYWVDASQKIKNNCAKDTLKHKAFGNWNDLNDTQKKECYDTYYVKSWFGKFGDFVASKLGLSGSSSGGTSASVDKPTTPTTPVAQTPSASTKPGETTPTTPVQKTPIVAGGPGQPISANLVPTTQIGPAGQPVYNAVAGFPIDTSGSQSLGGIGPSQGAPDTLPSGSTISGGGGSSGGATASVTNKPNGTNVTATPVNSSLVVTSTCDNPNGCEGGPVEVAVNNPDNESDNKIIRFQIPPIPAEQSAPQRTTGEIVSLFVLVGLLAILGGVSWFYFHEKKWVE